MFISYNDQIFVMKKLIPILSVLTVLILWSSCKKETVPALETLSFKNDELEMAVGEQQQLILFLTPGGADTQNLQYESDTPSVVSISETGEAKALKEGKAVITAKCGEKETSCKITVIIPVEKIEFTNPSVSMKVNDELKTLVTVTPSNATYAKRLEYEIDKAIDKSPIYVETNGALPNQITITAVKVGQETITARCGGKEAKLFVYVDDVKATGLTLSSTFITLKAGESHQLTATVEPSNASNKNVSWSSNNPKIVSVRNGLVTAHRSGSTNIWAYCGDKGAFCTVEVAPPDGGVDLGLSVFWASSNLGTNNPLQQGGHYAWGELSTKSTYTWASYKFRTSGNTWKTVKFSRYGSVDKKTDFSEYDYVDDAARQTLGGKWRVPTVAEFQELVDNTTLEKMVISGIGSVYKFTSTMPGYTDRSILMLQGSAMITDRKNELTMENMDIVGFYWLSSIWGDALNAHTGSLDTKNGKPVAQVDGLWINCYREWGLNIRPVWGE